MRISDWSSDVCSSDLAGIDQPARNAALGDPLFQQIAVNRRMAWHERRTKAGRESRFRFRDANFRACNLGGIAGKEMIHRLLGRQPCDRGQHTERVSRSEEHTSELQSLMRISYAVFCLKKKNT